MASGSVITKFHPFDCEKGDLLVFPSGRVRKVMSVKPGKFMQFVQIHDGVVGNYRSNRSKPHWRKKTKADGKRRTTYTWSDLRRMFR